MLDMITGLAVVGIIATTLVVLMGRERRLGAALGDRRAAARLAETTLADLRAGRTPTVGATSGENDGGNGPVTQVEVTALDDPATGAAPGRRWVEVRATVAGRTVTLVGLVPDGPGVPPAPPSTRPAETERPVESLRGLNRLDAVGGRRPAGDSSAFVVRASARIPLPEEGYGPKPALRTKTRMPEAP